MRRLLASVSVLAVASSAMALSLTTLPVTNPGTRNASPANYGQYHVQGMTDDGQYVVATKDLAGVADGIMVIKVSDLTTTVYQNKSQFAGRGIAAAPGGLALAGAVHSNGALGAAFNAGPVYNSYLKTQSGTSSESYVAVQNALSLDPATGNGFLVGSRTHNKGKEGLAWRYTNGVANITAVWGKIANGVDTDMNGASYDGIAVGSAGKPILADVANNGNAWNIAAFANTSTGNGQGNGISADHMYATGYYQNLLNTDDSLHAFRHTYNLITEELLPAGGDLTGSQQSNGLDAANDGTVVGFSYAGAGVGSYTGYRATVWLPGSTSGTLLQDILAANGVDMSAWSYLERCISVTPDGLTVAGRGVLVADGSYRGFVATIPEPATALFLGLGGLALLRRRH